MSILITFTLPNDDAIERNYLTQEIFSILPFERAGFSTLANPMLKPPFLDELEKIDELFKNNFGLVHNDKHLDDKEARYFFGNLVKKFANKFASEPIKNPIGQKWVKDHLDLKNRGIK